VHGFRDEMTRSGVLAHRYGDDQEFREKFQLHLTKLLTNRDWRSAGAAAQGTA